MQEKILVAFKQGLLYVSSGRAELERYKNTLKLTPVFVKAMDELMKHTLK